MSENGTTDPIRLTQYSHGAGCGCKIAPDVLEKIVQSEFNVPDDAQLIVGNSSKDDAAVYDLGNNQAVISTTDFFMPIVDDPFDFGRVALTNAISDIYAMGGEPLVAIAILGWPIDTLPAEVAAEVVDGGRQACREAGIILAGGHSIDAPEPIFGGAITGRIDLDCLKCNDQAEIDDHIYLTKPLGVGILTTAEKQGKLKPEHVGLALDTMCQMNSAGFRFGQLESINAMTDVTGFGLLGHLLEVCQGSSVEAELDVSKIPRLDGVDDYIAAGAVPGGTHRNHQSYGEHASEMSEHDKAILCDPQTSGGLLVTVSDEELDEFHDCLAQHEIEASFIGRITRPTEGPTIRLITT